MAYSTLVPGPFSEGTTLKLLPWDYLFEAFDPVNFPDIFNPIWIASLGPKNVETTAEIADGWMPLFFHPDKAKEVWGDDLARGIQLGIEYDPDPPFDSGSPEKADAQLVELVRGVA